jgi:hypothetical protein
MVIRMGMKLLIMFLYSKLETCMLSVLKEGKWGRLYLPFLSNKIPLAFCIFKWWWWCCVKKSFTCCEFQVLDLRSCKLVWNRRHPWQEGTCTVKQVATTYGIQETERLQLWQSGELFVDCLPLRTWGCKKPIQITVCDMEMSNVWGARRLQGAYSNHCHNMGVAQFSRSPQSVVGTHNTCVLHLPLWGVAFIQMPNQALSQWDVTVVQSFIYL